MLTLSQFYESIFGCKVYKISLDAGCTCPNRDGTKGFGGCIFCSERGSGDFATSRNFSIKEQVEEAKKRVEAKISGRSGARKGKFIVYFQNFTSTYGDTKFLVQKYKEALECEDITGLAIATRPDCLGSEILSEIAKISQNHFVQIELGLQTSNEKTGEFINRCYTNEDYSDAVKRIRFAAPKIHIVTHLIFGLPGETERDMLESVKFVVRENSINSSQIFEVHREFECRDGFSQIKNSSVFFAPYVKNFTDFFGIKITSLYVVRGTKLAEMYENGEYTPLQKEEYFELLKNALALFPENCVVHRLTGDPPKSILIAPIWTTDKKRVLNEIRAILPS